MLVAVAVVLVLLVDLLSLADLILLALITLVDLVVMVEHSPHFQHQLLLLQFPQLISQMLPLMRVVLEPLLKEQHLLR
jgi:hypothetical protein